MKKYYQWGYGLLLAAGLHAQDPAWYVKRDEKEDELYRHLLSLFFMHLRG
jgi:hypothetical protein